MGKAGCMCLGVFLLAMWGCCRASASCLWSGTAVARIKSRRRQLVEFDLLVVPMFGTDGGCTDAIALIAMLSALIVD